MRLRTGEKEVSPNCSQTCAYATWSKKRLRIVGKKCHHRNNVGQMLLRKNGMFPVFALFCPPTTVAVWYPLFQHPRFCTRCNTQLGDHFTTTCGNIFATSLQPLFPVLCCTSPVALNSFSSISATISSLIHSSLHELPSSHQESKTNLCTPVLSKPLSCHSTLIGTIKLQANFP